MAYDERLAERIRISLSGRKGMTERHMFGGIAFLLRGNMCCGVIQDLLMLRLGPEGAERALARPHAREMEFTGRPMKGMVYILPEGVRTERQLQGWVEQAAQFAQGLPKKRKVKQSARPAGKR